MDNVPLAGAGLSYSSWYSWPEGPQILAECTSFVNDNMNKHQTLQITINIEYINIFCTYLHGFSRVNKKCLMSIIKISIKTLVQVYLLK